MSLSVLLAQHNDVTVLDIDAERVGRVNNKQSTIADTEIESFLAQKSLSLTAALDKQAAYDGASFIVVATPTNYDSDTNLFDTKYYLPLIRGSHLILDHKVSSSYLFQEPKDGRVVFVLPYLGKTLVGTTEVSVFDRKNSMHRRRTRIPTKYL